MRSSAGGPTQVASKPELLAHHYACAGLDDRALEFWIRAGQRALARSANVEAAQHFTSALAAVERLPQDERSLQVALGCRIGRGAARRAVEGFASPGVEEDFAQARDLYARGAGTIAQLMDALRGLFACYYTRSDFRKAREQAERVLEYADSPPQLMMGNWMLGCVTLWQGQFVEARLRLETALQLYDPAVQRRETLDAQIDLEANAMLHLAWTLWFLGHPDQARARAEEAIALARGLGQPFALAMALFSACATRVCCGDDAEAGVLAEELRAVTVKYRIAYMSAACTVLEGHTAVARGDTTAGIERMRLALEEFRRQQAGLGWTFAISLPAAACAKLGQAEEGLALVAEAFEAAERNGDLFLKAELHRLEGDLLRAKSPTDLQGPINCYRQAAALATEQGAKSLELRALTSLARLDPVDDQVWQRLQVLYDSFDEGHLTADLTAARALLECATARTADAR